MEMPYISKNCQNMKKDIVLTFTMSLVIIEGTWALLFGIHKLAVVAYVHE